MSRKRVVLVCMVDSIHVARWIAQFEPSEVEFTLFPSTPNRRVHAMIKDMMNKNGNIKIVPFGGKLSIPLWGLDLVFSDYLRGMLLRGILKRTKPDFVHALEFQHGGYITSRALEDASIKTPFIATNYGSDIYWFQQFPKHLAKIKKLLARADRYSAECQRDVVLAKKYGFNGVVLPVFPNAGGIETSTLTSFDRPWDQRTIILVKGYTGWVGRANLILEALDAARDFLEGYQVVIYSANIRTKRKARRLLSGVDYQIYLKRALKHHELLSLMGRSKLHIAISKSDGLSTGAVEAFLLGANIIQTSTSCIDEMFPTLRELLVDPEISADSLSALIKTITEHNKRLGRPGDLASTLVHTSQNEYLTLASTFYLVPRKNKQKGTQDELA